jgi:mRNA interferase RelE/StbE
MIHHPCIGYTIIFSDDAKKSLRKLEKQTISRIFEKTKQLVSENPDNLNVKKLKSKIQLYRLKIGDYRIIYCIEYAKVIVYVVDVGHRRDIYNNLDRRLKIMT